MIVPVAMLYFGLMAAYFYAWKEDLGTNEPLGWIVLIGVGALQLAAGAIAGGWWTLALPFAAIALAVPFGYGEGVGQEAPIWVYYGYLFAVPAAVLVAAGVGVRRLYERRR